MLELHTMKGSCVMPNTCMTRLSHTRQPGPPKYLCHAHSARHANLQQRQNFAIFGSDMMWPSRLLHSSSWFLSRAACAQAHVHSREQPLKTAESPKSWLSVDPCAPATLSSVGSTHRWNGVHSKDNVTNFYDCKCQEQRRGNALAAISPGEKAVSFV